jgi:hypothetical protein
MDCERCHIDIHTDSSEWPSIDNSSTISSITRPLEILSEKIQSFTLTLRGEEEDVQFLTSSILGALPKSLRLLEWNSRHGDNWGPGDLYELITANSIEPIIQCLDRFEALEVLSLVVYSGEAF